MKVDTLKEGDYTQWAEVWRLYLEFYQATLPDSQYRNTWQRIIDPSGNLNAFVLRDDEDNIIGLSHYLFHCSSWSDKPLCYLNDLYVKPGLRGKGCGRLLIEETAKAAEAKGSNRLYWVTKENNTAARKLYDSLATFEFVQYRMPLNG